MKYTKILCLVFMIALISVFPVSATEGKNLPSEEQIKTLCESVTDKDNYASNLFESAKEKGYVCDLWACESCKGEKLAISFYYSANNAKGYKSIYTSQPGEYKSYIPNIELKDSYTGEERTYSKNGPESSCADCKTDSDKNDTETKSAYITVASTGGTTPVTYPTNGKLTWKGISWVWCQGPRVDRSNAWVDDNGDLNLRMQKFDGIYKGVLFETPTPYLYGRIRWTASSPTLNIERNASLGLNTYYDDPDTDIPNELDIEINQWPGYDERIWFSCHPASIDSHPENIHYGCLSTNPYVNDSGVVYTIEWTPSYVYYSVVASNGTTILDWNYTGDDIPHTSAYICMFFGVLAQGAGPASGNPITIKFSNFEYDSMRIAANFSAPVRSGTTDTTFSFSDTSTGLPRSWLWNFGDGTTSTEQNPTHRYTSPGTYTVTLTATNAVSTDTETKSAYITVASSGGGSPVIYPTDGKRHG
jgi:PKD repeat protein